MKDHRLRPALLALALSLALAACGGKTEAREFDPAADAKALLEAEGAFGDDLTEIDQATACLLYGIDETAVTSCAVYGSPSSAEELAIFALESEEAAATAAEAFQIRVEDRIDGLTDYMPDEIPKLKDAVIEVRGSTALLAIAADAAAVKDLLK